METDAPPRWRGFSVIVTLPNAASWLSVENISARPLLRTSFPTIPHHIVSAMCVNHESATYTSAVFGEGSM